MKNPYICTIIDISRRDRVLIILFQLHGSRLFEEDLLWVDLHDPIPNLHVGGRTNQILILLNKIFKQPI